MFILSDANLPENIVNDDGEGVGMDQWGVAGSCTCALPVGVTRILYISSASGGYFEIWGRQLRTLGTLLEAEPWMP